MRKKRSAACKEGAATAEVEAPKKKKKRVTSNLPGKTKDLHERKAGSGRQWGSKARSKEEPKEQEGAAEAGSNAAEPPSDADDGEMDPREADFDALPPAPAPNGRTAAPLTRTHAAPKMPDVSLSVAAIIAGFRKNTPRTPSVRKPTVPKNKRPALPKMEMFIRMGAEHGAPHKNCSACGNELEAGTCLYRVLTTVPQLSLCSTCYHAPTVMVAKLLLRSATVQEIRWPNNAQPMSSDDATSDEAVTPRGADGDVPAIDVDAIFRIVPPALVVIAEPCPKCGRDRGHRQVAGGRPPDEHGTPCRLLQTHPFLRWNKVELISWTCDCDTDATAQTPIRPTLLTCARHGLFSLRVITGPEGEIDLMYNYTIFTPTAQLEEAGRARVLTYASLQSFMDSRVDAARAAGHDVEPLSGPMRHLYLKALLMQWRSRDEIRRGLTQALNLGPCVGCAKIPTSPYGGTVMLMADATYAWNQMKKGSAKKVQAEADAVQAKAATASDDDALRSHRVLMLTSEQLGFAYSTRTALHGEVDVAPEGATIAPSPDGVAQESAQGPALAMDGTDAPSSSAPSFKLPSERASVQSHGARAERSVTGDACIAKDCHDNAKHKADQEYLRAPFDPVAAENAKTMIIGAVLCRHMIVRRVAVSDRPENYAFMMALLLYVFADQSFNAGADP